MITPERGWQPPTPEAIEEARVSHEKLVSLRKQYEDELDTCGPEDVVYGPDGQNGIQLTIDGKEELYGMSEVDLATFVNNQIGLWEESLQMVTEKVARSSAVPVDTRVRTEEDTTLRHVQAVSETTLAGWRALKQRIEAKGE